MTRSQVGPPTPSPTSSPYPFPTIDDRVQQSIDLWARNLRTLFDDARERFSDVSWETDIGDRVWAHKAIVYVRAPKAFKDRYFITGAKSITLARSPTSLSGPSPTPYLLSASSAHGSPSPNPWRAASSSLSVDTAGSDGTLRAPTVSVAGSSADGVLRLRHEDAPELFRAQLEWLYTGEGFGDVVEWISGEREGTSNTSLRDSLGRRGDVSERRDKLGQDLTYMWTSKLYCDVRIHLASPEGDGYDSDSSGASDDSLAATVIFTAHRFMLISRSPYFATLFLNEDFRPSTADVHLSTPPFTPAALHFCLGWMYAGHLDFSNRSYDLLTAFQIYRAAEYLQLDCLVEEIESRIVHDFCDGLDYNRCHCRRCLSRVPRVWRFAGASDVGALELQRRARRFILRGWGETWGREIGMAEKAERDDLVRDVLSSMTPSSVVGAFRAIANIRRRIDHFTHTRGADTTGWVDSINDMVQPIQRRAREFLASSFPQVCESKELWDLFSGKGFADEVLDIFWREVVEMTGRSPTFTVAPVVYETIVTALLRKVDPKTLEAVLPTRSANRHKVEMARDAVLKHIKKRWVSIQNEGGFVALKGRTLQEIASAIEVPAKELAATPQVPFPRVRDNGFPRTTSRAQGLGDRVRRTSARNSVQSDTATEPNGLRRLRLSSSASITSTTSTSRAPSAPQRPAPTGPQARSPTAAGRTPVVSVGSKRGLRSGQNSPTPSRQGQVMSGPPRPLLTGVGRVTRQGSASSRPSSPAISSPLSPAVRAESPAPLRLPSSSRTSSLASHSRNPSSTSQPPTPTSPVQSIRTQRSTASVRSAASRATAASTSKARMPAVTASSTAAKPNSIKPVRGESSAAKPASTVRPRTVSTAEVKPSRVSDAAKPTRPIASSSRLSDTAVTRQRTVSTASKAPDVTARARTVSAARAESSKLTSTLATRTRDLSTTAPSETKPPAVRKRTVSTASRAPEPKPTPPTRTRTLSTATTSTGPGTAAAAAASRQRTLSAASTRSRAPSMSSLAPSVGTVASRTSTMSSASTAAKARASTGSMRTTVSSSKATPVPKVAAKPTAAARATPAVRPTPSTAAKAGPSTAKASSSTPAKAASIAPSKAASITASRPPALRTSASTKSLASTSSLGARASTVPRTPTTSTKTVTPSASSSRLTTTTPRTRATSLNTQATPPPRPRTSSSHTPWKRATPLPPTVAGVAGQRAPRQRPSLRSLSGSTEGPPEAITPRVSDATEPILVLDEDNELTFERERERNADKVPPVPPIPESVRRRSTAEVVVEVSVPEENEDELAEELAIPQVVEEAPSDSESVYENSAYDETASNKDSAYAESDRDSTYQESVASAVRSVVSQESVASKNTASERTEDEHDGSVNGNVERSAEQSNGALVDQPVDTLVDEAEMAADAAERTTPPASTHAPSPNGTPTPRERGRDTEPPLMLNRDSEREAKTPTPASPFPPSRTRTPTASSQASLTSQASVASHSSASQRPQPSHTSLAPAPALRSPVSADQLRPVSEHLRSPASTDQLRPAHLRSPPTTRAPLPIPTLRAPGASPPSPPRYLSANARSPRSSYSSSPMSVISRVASESGSLRSLNSGWHPAHAFDPPKKAAAPTPLPPPPTPEEEDGCEPYSGLGVHLHIGIPAIVTRGRRRFRANVKYLGTLASRSGAWVGLEIQDRELGMDTLPTGAIDGIRYFHFTPPPDVPGDNDKGDRLRRIAMIADELRRTPNQNQNKLGLGLMRSASPFSITDGGPERPRAMFVRPSDVLFVMGSGE
ncbi:uncharacterized protein CcaverHIS019_0705810 [Cutaneotrichosporon cavernicola]|uniref:BTB domain-containing protein n=1 Tax=Cutaneotrichosporon cavernicola TaxID=279322 RepID=A0AA48LAM6_9TREE|nr:uncharacterized protein CcaverHIS019_0705810 [Cutaneotrichosporon cavernicola]BEI95000.1 hypothetical protein CcaverHIS019_0705810 [Cutaneotrichosporon cavernicola]